MADWKICCRINVSGDVVCVCVSHTDCCNEKEQRWIIGLLDSLTVHVTVQCAFHVDTYSDHLGYTAETPDVADVGLLWVLARRKQQLTL